LLVYFDAAGIFLAFDIESGDNFVAERNLLLFMAGVGLA
jgi:hypothetical protein